MKKIQFILAAFSMLLVNACSYQEEDYKGEETFEVRNIVCALGDLPETKTALQTDGKSIFWVKDDAINVFHGPEQSAKFVADVTEPSASASFSTAVGNITATIGGTATDYTYWAVYPYDEGNQLDGAGVSLTIPSVQEGAAGTFANNLNPTVASTGNILSPLSFKNVGSWFIFSITQDDVVSATITGAKGENLAGKIRVTMDADNKPAYEVLNGEKSITLNAPAGTSFQKNVQYYMVLLPQTLSEGFTLKLTKSDGAEAEWSISSPVTFYRSSYCRKVEADKGLTYSKPAPATRMYFPESHYDIRPGEEIYVEMQFEPENATNKEEILSSMHIESSLEKVASVIRYDKGVKILGQEKFNSSTTIRAGYNTLSAECSVTLIPYDVNSISLDKTTLDIVKDEKVKLNVTFDPANSEDGHSVSWTSSDPAVATVVGGVVTGTGSGTATITAACEGKTATCEVNVTVPLQSLVLNKEELTLARGKSEQLIATITPADATEHEITWTSYDPELASVDENGVVTAIAEGMALIEARCGKLVKSCLVKIYVAVDRFYLKTTSLEIPMGGTFDFKAAGYGYSPADATDKTITWTSDNPDDLPIDENGRITAIGWTSQLPISANYTITAKMGDITSECRVTIYRGVDRLYFDKTSLALKKGESTSVNLTVEPVGYLFYHQWTVTSSNTNVAVVEAKGDSYLITARNPGEATITAKVEGEERSATLTVSVTNIPVESVQLNQSSITFDRIGASEQLTATILPTNAYNQNVTWSSSNESVATVSSNGTVTSVGDGTSIITVTTEDGGKTATCEVEVAAFAISFKDDVVKSICLSNWDSNDDGYISYEEAAAVTSLAGKFKGTSISSFDEFKYFTGILSIGANEFRECSSLTSITIPNYRVNFIGNYAFNNCTSLTSINIPASVLSIGSYAFEGCSGLTTVTIKPSSRLTSIETRAFYDCTSLTSINIPASVSSIGGGAFEGCSGLTQITLPNSLTKISDSLFRRCYKLTSITIPAGVTSIGNCAFQYTRLISINIPDSVTSIGGHAFDGCHLTSIEIPDDITIIEEYTFAGCSELTSITIPAGVTSIGFRAFWTSGLTSVTIPNGVTSIGEAAFAACDALSMVTVLSATPPTIGTDVFYSTSYGTPYPIYVPSGSVNDYKTATNWSTYSDRIQAIEN